MDGRIEIHVSAKQKQQKNLKFIVEENSLGLLLCCQICLKKNFIFHTWKSVKVSRRVWKFV